MQLKRHQWDAAIPVRKAAPLIVPVNARAYVKLLVKVNVKGLAEVDVKILVMGLVVTVVIDTWNRQSQSIGTYCCNSIITTNEFWKC